MDSKELESWLERHTRQDVAVIMARTAARAVPYATIIGLSGNASEREKNFFFSYMRMVFLACEQQQRASKYLSSKENSLFESAKSIDSIENGYIVSYVARTAKALEAIFTSPIFDEEFNTRNPDPKSLLHRFGNEAAVNFIMYLVNNRTPQTKELAQAILSDFKAVDQFETLDHFFPLWPAPVPDHIAVAWQSTLDYFSDSRTWAGSGATDVAEDIPDYRSFWIPWYQGLLDGKPAFPEALTRAIALIDEQDWDKGELHINNVVIPRLMAEHSQTDGTGASEPEPLSRQLDRLPPAPAKEVASVRAAMVQNCRELPPTFGAVLGYIALEVARLQDRNYRDEEDRVECQRQISVLATLGEAIEGLRALVPTTAEMPLENAEKAEKLTRIFIDKITEWPRANADELADSTCRMAIVGGIAAALPMVGIGTPYAMAIGMVFFGGKSIGAALKAAKDVLPRSGGTP